MLKYVFVEVNRSENTVKWSTNIKAKVNVCENKRNNVNIRVCKGEWTWIYGKHEIKK